MKEKILAKLDFAKSYIGIENKAVAWLATITFIFFCFDVTSKLGYAMISSFIFYLVVIRHKQCSDKEKIKPFLNSSIFKITQECTLLLADFSKNLNGTALELDSLTEDDIKIAFSSISPNGVSNYGLLSQSGQFNNLNYAQNMALRVSDTESHINKMFRVNLDADLISKLSKLENCLYFTIIKTVGGIVSNNANLSFIDKQFYDYCIAVRELKNHTL